MRIERKTKYSEARNTVCTRRVETSGKGVVRQRDKSKENERKEGWATVREEKGVPLDNARICFLANTGVWLPASPEAT